MMNIGIMLAALALAPAAQADTIVAVDRGAHLEVANFRGEVTIRSWNRDAVRVEAEFSGRQTLDLVRTGSAVRIRPQTHNGPRDAEFRIDIPRWMDVRVEGNQVDVRVEGADGEISVETIGGDVVVEGGSGLVSLRSIQGGITVRGAAGRVEAMSVNEDVSLTDIRGEIYVETTNGDVAMRGIRSSTTRATTVNGDVLYDGSIADGGRYIFSTHNGEIEVTIAEDANATVSVSTYHGEFESEFPVQLTGTTRDRQFTFTLGSGSARIELESFNGEILLRRPH